MRGESHNAARVYVRKSKQTPATRFYSKLKKKRQKDKKSIRRLFMYHTHVIVPETLFLYFGEFWIIIIKKKKTRKKLLLRISPQYLAGKAAAARRGELNWVKKMEKMKRTSLILLYFSERCDVVYQPYAFVRERLKWFCFSMGSLGRWFMYTRAWFLCIMCERKTNYYY